jgi:cytochrome c
MPRALRLPGKAVCALRRRHHFFAQEDSEKMYQPKHIATAMTLAAGLLSAPGIQADQAIAQSKGCLACHQVDNKVVGPAFKDIAAKYKGDSSAPAMLAAKVKAGGVGTWGQIPMPPNPTVSDEDANTLVVWVLSL